MALPENASLQVETSELSLGVQTAVVSAEPGQSELPGVSVSHHPHRRLATPHFLLSFGLLLLILLGLNLAIRALAAQSQRGQLLSRLEHIPPQTDCIFLGNSLVEAGCDTATFRSAWPDSAHPAWPINLALGATSPVEHFLILRRALESPVRPKYLIYGFFDDQLCAPVRGDWADLVGNRAFSYYFPDQAARLYAPGSWLKRWQLRVIAHIPMLAERSSLWTKVELLRRRLEDIGMPKHKSNRYGRVDDFSALEAADAGAFAKRCNSFLSQNQGFSRPVAEIIRLARERGVKVILVEMPLPSRHRDTFYSLPAWRELRTQLQLLARQEGAQYLSASDWIADDTKFEDATHLGEAGARLFSARLARTIARDKDETGGVEAAKYGREN